jgi:alcohol oxidase
LAHDFLRASDSLGIPFSGTHIFSFPTLSPISLLELTEITFYTILDDIQDLQTSHASEIWAKYINRHTGRRSDAASAYVHSVMDIQSNLYLRTNARVNRVIFEGNKAVGVAYVPARNRADGGRLVETIVKARKYVVLSSGTLGTPQILERSGVGKQELLKKLDIKCVSDLPGVGEEYQDHYTTLSSKLP